MKHGRRNSKHCSRVCPLWTFGSTRKLACIATFLPSSQNSVGTGDSSTLYLHGCPRASLVSSSSSRQSITRRAAISCDASGIAYSPATSAPTLEDQRPAFGEFSRSLSGKQFVPAPELTERASGKRKRHALFRAHAVAASGCLFPASAQEEQS